MRTRLTGRKLRAILFFTPRAAQWPLHSSSRRPCFVSFLCVLFFCSFFLLYSETRRDVSVLHEVVVATVLRRLAAQPDRPIARLLSPSAILPLPEHKEATDRTVAETHDHRFHPYTTTTIILGHCHHHYHPNGGGSTCVLRLRSFVGVLTFDMGFYGRIKRAALANIPRIVSRLCDSFAIYST